MAAYISSYTFRLLENMKRKSDEERNNLLQESSVFDDKFDRFGFIVKNIFDNYEFDYSVLNGADELIKKRREKEKTFEYNGEKYRYHSIASDDVDEKHNIPLSPSVHALKMGTCATLSSELLWFAKELGIQCERVSEICNCFDSYEETGNEPSIRKMKHYYVIIGCGDEKYKVDIAGAMMAKDFLKQNPKSNIKPKDFLFVDEKTKNPFDEIKIQESES